MEPEFTGLSTFDAFPSGNASNVDTKVRFGSKLLLGSLLKGIKRKRKKKRMVMQWK